MRFIILFLIAITLGFVIGFIWGVEFEREDKDNRKEK